MYLQILFAGLQPRLLEPTNSAQLTVVSESAQPQGPFWGWSKEREARSSVLRAVTGPRPSASPTNQARYHFYSMERLQLNLRATLNQFYSTILKETCLFI